MRISKFGGVLASSALAASAVLGSAGIANAQGSLGSLTGSLESEAVELTVAGDVDGIGGEITNNTDAGLTCSVGAMDAALMREYQALREAGSTDAEASDALFDEFEKARDEGKFAVHLYLTIPAGKTVDWVGGSHYGPAEDFVAGAVADCDGQAFFAYESTGPLGSLNMGSLAS